MLINTRNTSHDVPPPKTVVRLFMAKPTVYRVEDIAEHTSKDDLKHLFTQTCQPQIKVASLSKAADWNEQNRTLVATCLFTPKAALDKPEVLDARLSIDSDFHGFTPLYTPDGMIDADIIALTGLAGHAYGSMDTTPASKPTSLVALCSTIAPISLSSYKICDIKASVLTDQLYSLDIVLAV